MLDPDAPSMFELQWHTNVILLVYLIVFIKIIVDKETDCILGAQMMCAHATDMISQFTQAIQQELTLVDLQKIIFPHPTFNEAIGKAVE